jgi:hypothetical protein
MKSSIKHGGLVSCDMVHVHDDEFTDECEQRFISYSVSAIVRAQALNAGWDRVAAGHVKWPGEPPCANGKKVDLCPLHAHLVMTEAEYQAKRKAERAQMKAEKAADRAKAKAAENAITRSHSRKRTRTQPSST